jgi:hypothetical protein
MGIIVFHPTISSFAQKLEAAGFENQGRESDDTLLYDFVKGGECIRPDDKAGLKRFRRLSTKRWAKWFFTDPIGNPSLICVAERDEN